MVQLTLNQNKPSGARDTHKPSQAAPQQGAPSAGALGCPRRLWCLEHRLLYCFMGWFPVLERALVTEPLGQQLASRMQMPPLPGQA